MAAEVGVFSGMWRKWVVFNPTRIREKIKEKCSLLKSRNLVSGNSPLTVICQSVPVTVALFNSAPACNSAEQNAIHSQSVQYTVGASVQASSQQQASKKCKQSVRQGAS